ncbi:Cyclin [Rhizoctonia solani]|uniref:Cyclin n=1 Tax=Rhizoctonia solani TaxID=456999 RepID=A0A8H7MAA9_9AGAM|nr:Cyclin [Rhizoctonia solani]
MIALAPRTDPRPTSAAVNERIDPSTTTTSSAPTTTEPATTSTPAAAPTAPAATPTPTATPNVPTATTANRPTVARMQRLADGSLDLGAYPSTDLLRLLAALLTQITTENDKLRPQSTPQTPLTPPSESPDTRSPMWSQLTSASRNALATPAASLAFHARNIRVFPLSSICCAFSNTVQPQTRFSSACSSISTACQGSLPTVPFPYPLFHRTLTIDSYNIHRLLIAGVTVASKFFSDVFYTNSRYAKVGGLPQTELNQLELHFLLLNDFRLSIPIDEMQRYAEQLLRYSAGMSPEEAFAPSATAPPPTALAPPSPHTPLVPLHPPPVPNPNPKHTDPPTFNSSPGPTHLPPREQVPVTSLRAFQPTLSPKHLTTTLKPVPGTPNNAAHPRPPSRRPAMTEGEDDAASTNTVEEPDHDAPRQRT